MNVVLTPLKIFPRLPPRWLWIRFAFVFLMLAPSFALCQPLLSREEAVRLALTQASNYEQLQLNEKSVAEDVRQAQTAFLPKVIASPSLIYNTPSIGADIAHTPSFIGSNAISEFQGLVGVTGEIDVAKRLRATLNRNRALLEAAHAGTEIARRALIQGTEESYYALALANARKRLSEQTLEAALEFERITGLLVTGGEVAPVDAVRARLQTAARRDELEQTAANEAVAADALRVLIGSEINASITTIDLLTALPDATELQNFAPIISAEAINSSITKRPEFLQFDALRRAAIADVGLARSERRPQFSYSLSGGFASDALRWTSLKQHSGVLATFSLTIPIFDWGASRSRELQAQLRSQALESTRTVALRGYAQQFSTARVQAISASARIRLAGNSLTDAQHNVEVSIARYKAGEAQIVEVTDAQNTLAAQRIALAQAIYDYQVALARLRQATGK